MAKKTAGKKPPAKKAAQKPSKSAVKKVSRKVTTAPVAKAKAKKVAEPVAPAPAVVKQKVAAPPTPKIVPEKLVADEAEFDLKPKKEPKAKKKTKRQIAAEEELDQMGKKWAALMKKSEKMAIKAHPYNMRKSFDARTPIEHKILGWGYILNNKNDRLEVLFKDGIKFLISNYKG